MTDPVRLAPEAVEAVAQRVVELLRDTRAAPARLVDAAELGALLGVSRDTVYEHAAELGALRTGTGKRARLRFDVDEAKAAWRRQAQRPSAPDSPRVAAPRRRAAAPGGEELLPIKGRQAA